MAISLSDRIGCGTNRLVRSSRSPMTPRLVAVSGPLEGVVIPIPEAEILIGRDTETTVCLNDPLVSRKHCLVRRAGETVLVADLQSANGTWVNGLAVRERELQHEDRIKLGGSQCVFLRRDVSPEGGTVPFDEDDTHTTRIITARLGPEDAVYLQPERLIEKPSASDRVARDLSALLRVSTSISAIR